MSASIDRRHVAAGPARRPTSSSSRPRCASSRRVVRRGEARGRAVERGAHHVEVAHLLHVERRHLHALAAGLDQEALAPQQHHGLQHRLAADAEFLGELLLGEPGAGFQLARADGFEDGVVDAFAEIGFGKEGSHDGLYTEHRAARVNESSGF